MAADEKILQAVLDTARGCVLRGQAHLALGHLNCIQSQIEDFVGTSLWVKHELIYAGALAGMRDPDAEAVFEETVKRLTNLSEADKPLEMLVHGDFGKYLAERRSYRHAREHYKIAERIAEYLDVAEDVAHYQMNIILLGLEEDRGPLLGAFQKLKEAAKDGYTPVEQREAWIHYTEAFQDSGAQLVAARKRCEASVDYFRGKLSEIRRDRK